MKVYTMDGQVHEFRSDVRVKFWTPEVLTVLQSWTHRDDVIAGHVHIADRVAQLLERHGLADVPDTVEGLV